MFLWRDDDINVHTDISLFLKVHSLFDKYNKLHTVAVEMEDLWENKEIWYVLVTRPNIKVDLHGWNHKDYSMLSYDEVYKDIRMSLDYWKEHVIRGYGNVLIGNKIITTFYPPWNKVSDNLVRACRDCGLKLDARIGGEVYGFHYWACIDDIPFKELEDNLSKY